MSGDTPPRVFPKLRFPQFDQEPAWECPPLKKLAKRVTKRNTEGKDLRPLTNSAEHGVVDQREFFDKDIATTTDNYFVVEPGDYVYNPRVSATAPVGPISRNGVGTGVMSPLYTVFRFRSDANDYFAHYFKSSHWHQYLRRISNSGARHDRMAITNDDFMGMPVPTPSPKEQQKIADCLGSLENLIAAEGRKLEALRRHKQGLMQQLFPQPGETVPRLRFPEFRGEPAWTAKQLGDLDPFVTSGSRGWARHYSDSGDLFIRITNLTRESIYIDLTDSKYVDLPSMTSEAERTRVQKHDVLISVTADIGIVGFVGEAVPLPAYINQHIALVRCDEEHVCSEYIAAYLASDVAQRRFCESADQGAKAGMNLDEVRRITLFLPRREEQHQIVSCLRSVQSQLDLQRDWLDTLRLHKKALLQQLFPPLPGPEQ